MMNTMTIAGFSLALLVGIGAGPAAGADGRGEGLAAPGWDAWLGCWQAKEAPDRVVCFLPGSDASSARLVSVERGSIVDETVIAAGGGARAVVEGVCTGEERAAWSRDGRRVYLRRELACNGIGRVETAVLAFVGPGEWVHAETVTVAGQHTGWMTRYREAPASEVPESLAAALPAGFGLARETARLNATAPLGIDDVIEAAGLLAPPALESLLAARGHGYALDGRGLVRLDSHGVPPDVIDVMVALSYPEVFAVEESVQPTYAAEQQDAAPGVVDVYCYDPIFGRRSRLYGPYYGYAHGYGYGYGYGSRYGRLGFGCPGYGGYYGGLGFGPYGWGGARPIIVTVQPIAGDLRPRAEAVRGRGYTRGGSTAGENDAGDRTVAVPRGGRSEPGSAPVTGGHPTPRTTATRTTATPRPAAAPSSSASTATARPAPSSGAAPTGRTAERRPADPGDND